MAITDLPTPPSRSAPSTFSTLADAFVAALPTFVTEANAQAAALTLNDTTDTSSTSIAIGLGAKVFTVTAAKSFQPGMYLAIADTAAPSTNAMYGSVTSYSGTTLTMNILGIIGTGTKSAWTISQSVPLGTVVGPISGTTGTFSGLITATGGQIAFPATAVPSADANTLDDYEEGTFTPTFTNGVTTPDYSVQTGHYTKIGRQVFIMVYMAVGASFVGAAAVLRIGALPFTAQSGVDTGAYLCEHNGFFAQAVNNPPIFRIAGATTEIRLAGYDASAYNGTNCTASKKFILVGQYMV